MRSIDRIRSVVRFEKTDTVPVFSHIYGFAAMLKRIPLREYLNSGELMALCQLEAWKRFGYDGVSAFADNTLESEAIGTRIAYENDAYPRIVEYCLGDIRESHKLSIPNPEKDGRMPVIIEACRILKEEAGKETAVIGTVQGPVTLAGQLLGIEKLIYSLVDYPREFNKLLDFTTSAMVVFGKALVAAGADVIHIFDPSSSCSVINRTIFEHYVLPHLRLMIKEYKAVSNPICWLNITGQTGPILDLFPESGADLFNIDYIVPLSLAMEKLPNHCINGNIKPLSFIYDEEEVIERMAKNLLRQTQYRKGFILSPGCEVPLGARERNVEAMVRAAKGYGN